MSTSDTNIRCPRCNKPCSLSTVYCGTCGYKLGSTKNGTQTSSTTQIISTDNARSSNVDNAPSSQAHRIPIGGLPGLSQQGPFNSSPKPPQLIQSTPPIMPQKTFWTAKKFLLLFGVLLALLVSAGVGMFTYAYQLGQKQALTTLGTTPTHQTARIQATTPVTGTSSTPLATGTTPSVPSPSATTSQGQTPRTINENLTIPCASCKFPKMLLVLNTIIVDSISDTATWNFTFINQDTISCGVIESVHAGYINISTPLTLEDTSGNTYQGKGTINQSWAVAAGQSVQLNSIFSSLPMSRTQYTFSLTVNIDQCSNGITDNNVYQTETVTF